MGTRKIWEEEFRAHTFHLDPKRKTHLTAICNFLQEGASIHAEQAGFGYENMLKNNQVWVLTRMKVVVNDYPGWNEKLKLQTWSRGNQGIFYVRDFNIDDGHGKSVVKASSSWTAINTQTRRPELVKDLENGLYTWTDKAAIEGTLGKIPALKKPKLLRSRRIEYTDIDLVYHVNNVKYIELIINSFPKEMHREMSVHALEVNYLGEAMLADEVLIYAEEMGQKSIKVNIVRQSDEKEVCRAKLDWK